MKKVVLGGAKIVFYLGDILDGKIISYKEFGIIVVLKNGKHAGSYKKNYLRHRWELAWNSIKHEKK